MSGLAASVAGGILRLIACTLPASVRARYREEWDSDLLGAEELRVSRTSVLFGALVTAASIDRDSPLVLGIPIPVEAVRRARWAAALLSSSVVLACGLWWNGGYLPDEYAEPGSLGWSAGFGAVLGLGLGSLAALFATLGVWQLMRAMMLGVRIYGARRTLLLGLLAPACLLALALLAFVPFIGVLYVFAAMVTALVLAAGGPGGTAIRSQPDRRRRILLALPFVVATPIVLVLVLAHVFIWNPTVKMPGMTLKQVYTGMREAGEGTGLAFAVCCTVLILLAAVALCVFAASRISAGPRAARRILVLGFLLLATAAGSTWFLGFSMGMGIADTFGTTGGDAAVGGPLLSALGQLALICAIVAGFAPSSRDRYRETDPAPIAV